MAMNKFYEMDEFEDANGTRIFSFKCRREAHLERILCDGMQVVGGVALAAYTWKMNFHPMWTVTFSTMTLEGIILFLKDAQKYLKELPVIARDRICSRVFLPIGTFTYVTNVYAFSKASKQGGLLWIPCLGIAVSGLIIATASLRRLGKIVFNRTRTWKIINNLNQLLYGPALIGGGFYYLVIVQEHDEKWLRILPLIMAVFAANNVASNGYNRDARKDGPRWLLYKGLELLAGGIFVCISGVVLCIYDEKNDLHPVWGFFSAAMVISGLINILGSLQSFQVHFRIRRRVFYSICGMIGGPILFLVCCISLNYVSEPIAVPIHVAGAGMSLCILGESILQLEEHVPHPLYVKYCQRVLGPMLATYSSLVSGYAGYRMGWRYSLFMVPLIGAGIFYTYRGFSRGRL